MRRRTWWADPTPEALLRTIRVEPWRIDVPLAALKDWIDEHLKGRDVLLEDKLVRSKIREDAGRYGSTYPISLSDNDSQAPTMTGNPPRYLTKPGGAVVWYPLAFRRATGIKAVYEKSTLRIEVGVDWVIVRTASLVPLKEATCTTSGGASRPSRRSGSGTPSTPGPTTSGATGEP